MEPPLYPVYGHFVAVGGEAAGTPHAAVGQYGHLSPTAGAYCAVQPLLAERHAVPLREALKTPVEAAEVEEGLPLGFIAAFFQLPH